MSASRIHISEIEVRVTDRCVARCDHCAGSFSVNGRNTLSVEIASQFLDAFTTRWGTPSHWSLSGGEPMLFPDRVYELAQLGCSRGIAPRLATNGFWADLPDRTLTEVGRLQEEHFSHVWISTDSFHTESVPLRNVYVLIESLRQKGIPFFVNLNYLFPAGEELGGVGLPETRVEVAGDIETLRIHQDIAKITADDAHGWCRVMDLGRGRELIDSLGDVAGEARRVLQQFSDQVERLGVLDLGADGSVIYRCRTIGNVCDEDFPEFLDYLS